MSVQNPAIVSATPDTTISTTISTTETSKKDLRNAVRASFIGTFVEWFDYAAYMYMASIIAGVFFPELTGRVALINTFALFALSFLIRPIGAVAWGHIGDRLGRTKSLSASILFMSLATFCIALLPGYNSIGIAAPILLLVLRLIQGFSASGEYAAASTYISESAPQNRRGLFASVVPAATACGLLLGSLFVALLTSLLDDASLASWGWRLPFLLAAPLGIVGLIIRRMAPETHVADEDSAKKLPILEVFKYPRALLVAFSGAILNAIGFYMVLAYLPTYLSEELGMSSSSAFIATTISSTVYAVLVVATGALSDRLGRRTTMLIAAALFAVFSIPAFLALDSASFVGVILIQVGMGACLALNDGVLPSFISEQFPADVRLTGFALTFNCANAFFGGTAAMIATWMIGASGNVIAPAYYMVAAAIITAIGVAFAAKSK